MTKNFHDPNSANQRSDHSTRGATDREAEETLRMVAELPPPSELTDRVHQRLSHARVLLPRRRFWSFWLPAQRLQFAGAAVLVVVFAGSTWSVYYSKNSHAKNGTPTGVAGPQSPASPAPGGFSTAGAERRPATLAPIEVPPAHKKKPSASHTAAKRTPKADATQSEATPAGLKPPATPE